jgi:hypothetical protein
MNRKAVSLVETHAYLIIDTQAGLHEFATCWILTFVAIYDAAHHKEISILANNEEI